MLSEGVLSSSGDGAFGDMEEGPLNPLEEVTGVSIQTRKVGRERKRPHGAQTADTECGCWVPSEPRGNLGRMGGSQAQAQAKEGDLPDAPSPVPGCPAQSHSPGLGLSCRATTYLDLFRSPSRKMTTRSRMSSALLEVKVYSSPLMVASVKLGAVSLAPLQDQHGEQGPAGLSPAQPG